jgi:cellulose synthase/poly-beta-1,6-N-acetylglucosamine synthase-like glycosyltransferase
MPADVPPVTVQLPMRNEYHVAARVIEAASRLDYPIERLQIQVLDDSDDDTRVVVDRAVAAARARGVPIELLRRSQPSGYKAGAMRDALPAASGEFIAVFDADFIPPRDFLLRAVPHLCAEPALALVQGRWDFQNRDHSLLTRVQAVALDSLMALEQPVRSNARKVFQFNGTAGIWRRSAIAEVDGFAARTVTEDLEASTKLLLRRWRFLHLDDLVSATELPDDMNAYRAQQRRWTLGNAQVLRNQFFAIAASDAPLSVRARILLHLAGRLVYVALFLMTLAFLATRAENVFWFSGLTVALSVYLATAARRAEKNVGEAIRMTIPLMAISIGLSLQLSFAFARGLFLRDAIFVRTPKRGADDTSRYQLPQSPMPFIEAGYAVLHLVGAVVLASQAFWPAAAFALFLAVSFGWVSGASLFHSSSLTRRIRPVPCASENSVV